MRVFGGKNHVWLCFYATSILLFSWIMSNVPLLAIPNAVDDDALFVRLATNLLRGHWLGPYDNLTLAKGPFYPIWIALGWVSGLPILVTQGIAYAGASLFLIRGIRVWLGSEAVAFAVFLFILFNPLTFSWDDLRVMREGIYVPETILLLAFCVWWFRWRDRSAGARAGLAVGFGTVLGLFWCTREEGLWVAPALLSSFSLALLMLLLKTTGSGLRRMLAIWPALWREMSLAALVLAVAMLLISGVVWMNWRTYGVADVVEFKQPEFLEGYGALSRVKHQQPWKPYVVIPRETLARIFAVSSAASELRPYFETDAFVQVGCDAYAVAPCDGEIRAGWFMWAFREAVAQAGHYRSAVEARDFYGRLASEIAAACDRRQLDCLPPRATMVPPFRWEDLPQTAHTAVRMLRFMATLESVSVARDPISCLIDDCGQSPLLTDFLDIVHTPLFVLVPRLTHNFQRRSSAAGKLAFQQRAALVAEGLNAITAVYRTMMPWLLGLALAAYCASIILDLRRRRCEPLVLVASLAAIAVVSRVGLLAYLDAVAIPSVHTLYLSPAYPPMLLFGVTSIVALTKSTRTSKPRSELNSGHRLRRKELVG